MRHKCGKQKLRLKQLRDLKEKRRRTWSTEKNHFFMCYFKVLKMSMKW